MKKWGEAPGAGAGSMRWSPEEPGIIPGYCGLMKGTRGWMGEVGGTVSSHKMNSPLRNVRGWFSVQFQFLARFKIKKARGLIWGGTPRFSLILRTHTLDVRDGPTEHSGY